MKESIEALVKSHSRRFKSDGAVFAFQIGSSLKEEDFFDNSDLDFLVVYDKKIRKGFILNRGKGIEINIMRRSRERFLKLLEDGNPVDLIALRFGKVLLDDGFVEGLRKKEYEPTQRTMEQWMHTASLNLSSVTSNYSLPACMCCYFRELHHSARDFSRAMIVKEKNDLVEGDAAVLGRLESLYPELVDGYRLILDGRRNYQKFESKYVKTVKIEENELGRYLLAGEEFARKAYKVVLGLSLPRVNDLISDLEKKYIIDHYHGFWLSSERKEIIVGLVLEGDRLKYFTYDLGIGEWKD